MAAAGFRTGVRGVVQIVHGIAEYVERYDEFARYLNGLGYLVVAEDHMGHGGSVGESETKGYFHGGWFYGSCGHIPAAGEHPSGLSGGPFMCCSAIPWGPFYDPDHSGKVPDSGISACVICGTGWQPQALLAGAIPVCKWVCKHDGETSPAPSWKKSCSAPTTPVWSPQDPLRLAEPGRGGGAGLCG